MKTFALALLVSCSASAQVVNLCGAGRVCRPSAVVVGTGGNQTLFGLAPNGPFSTTLPGFKYNTSLGLLGIWTANNAVSFALNLGNGLIEASNDLRVGNATFFTRTQPTAVWFSNYSNDSSLSSAPGAVLLSGTTAAQRLYRGSAARWSRVASGTHPVYDSPTYTIDIGQGANTPEWQYAPRNSAGTAVTIVEGCTAGTLVAGSRLTRFDGRTSSSRSRSTSAVANATCGYVTSLVGKVTNLRPNVATAVRAPSNLTSVRFLAGFGPDALFSAPADTPTQEGAWFRFSSAAGDTNWMACTSTGLAAAVCASTGVAVVADQTADLEIDAMTQSGAITFWVNGVARVRVTTNLPGGTADVEFGALVQTLTAANRNFAQSITTVEMTL